REERAQRIIPADDHRQAWLLCRNTVATHRHLAGGGWWWAVWRDGDSQELTASPERLGARAAAHGAGIAWLLAGVGAGERGLPRRAASARGRAQPPRWAHLPLQ